MDISESAYLAISNLTSVPVLAFLVGVLAAVVLRTELRLPDVVYKAISMYLLLAIGLKGGVALREAGLLTAPAGGVAVRLLPPLTASARELEESVEVMTRVIGDWKPA